ncbi:MAG: hypothetical protein ACJ75J_18245 [Cytophagaceae bacterium]
MKVYYKTSIVNSYLSGMLIALFIIPGILLAIDGSILGYALILLWIFLNSMAKGAKIDFENKRISFFFSVFWIKFDNWIPASEFKRFKILNVNESRQVYSRVNSVTIRHQTTAIELEIPETTNFKRVAEDDLEEIRKLVERFKTEFNYERIIPKKR